jgi:hypothetical protein
MSGVAIIALTLPTLGIAYVLVTVALGLTSGWLGYIWGRKLQASGRIA